MIDWMVAIVSNGRRIGRITVVAVFHQDAPSSCAASRTSPGIALMPAYIVTSTNGNEHQITSAATSAYVDIWSYVQEWPVVPSTSLTRPKSRSNRNSHTYEPAIAGVAHAPSAARKSSMRGTARTRLASTANAVPTSRLPITHTAANRTVDSSTDQNS